MVGYYTNDFMNHQKGKVKYFSLQSVLYVFFFLTNTTLIVYHLPQQKQNAPISQRCRGREGKQIPPVLQNPNMVPAVKSQRSNAGSRAASAAAKLSV